MPFIPRGPEKPPWARDTQADVPWRRNNVVVPGKLNLSERNPPTAVSNPQSPPSKPGTSKLQINLKPAQQQPAEPPHQLQQTGRKGEIPIPIQTPTSTSLPIVQQQQQQPQQQNSVRNTRAKEISIPIFKEDSTPIQPVPPTPIKNSKFNPPQSQPQPQPTHNNSNNSNSIPIAIKKSKDSTTPPRQPTNQRIVEEQPSSIPTGPRKNNRFEKPTLKQTNIVIPIQKSGQTPVDTTEGDPPSPPPLFRTNLKPVELRNSVKPKKEPSPPPLILPALKKVQVNNNMSSAKPPPPPPPPPLSGMGPPPPPPPPGGLPPQGPISEEKRAKLEKLKKVPKKRPDWSVMMKEIETSRNLKHVECNDRSKPIIPKMKSRGKFVFDSEAKPANKADAIHNRLLTEIASGVKLKKVQCNDRSKPVLSGLRKFRRQMTMEEKDKGTSTPDEPAAPVSEVSLIDIDIDDIDTLRDELQSAKQMLELEIQAKILLAKENRDLKCQNILREAQIDELKYELEQQLSLIPYDEGRRDSRPFKDLRKSKSGLYKCPSGVKKSKSGFGPKGDRGKDKKDDIEEDLGELNELEEEINALRTQIHASKKVAEDWELKHKEATDKLLLAQGKYEDSEQQRLVLEKKLERLQTSKGVTVSSNNKWTQTEEQIQQMQNRRVSRQSSTTSNRKPSVAGGGDGDMGDLDSGDELNSDDSDLELDEATVIRKKEEREIKLWENKLRNVKEKQLASKTERKSLKIQQKKLEQELKEQKNRHKELQKEVDKMAKMLKGGGGGDDDDEDEEEEDEEEEEEEENEDEEEDEESSEEESSSESEEESSEEEDDPDAPHQERINLFTKRVKRWDNILNALRKGNYLLRANIDRLKDDLEDVRIKYHDLEHELNTVLADV